MSDGGFDDLRDVRVPRPPMRVIGLAALVIVAIAIVWSSFYTVGPEENGVVLRFGEYVRTTDPGLQFKLPLGIERVYKIPVQRQLKEEFGFQTVRAGVRSQFSTQGRAEEARMLTGDLNAAVVEWVVQYRIVDTYNFLFRVRNVRDTLRFMSEAIMRQVVGDRTVNEVLTVGRQEVASLVEVKLQELCDAYELGLRIDQVVLQDVNPPEPVRGAFNEVNEAQQQRERLINEAQSEYNQVIPRARGTAQQTIQQAEGYKLDRVNRAQGDAERFTELYQAYALAPEVTRKRMYLETLNDILPNVESKIVLDESLQGILPLLDLKSPGTGQTQGGR
ncbi:MAG TPA: FtsH protease activity modulator HflK [Candidatus Krumholzibacteria bacterium]|nr:FtsH protease activity modulator HflK [Candidatus Krumholzibacteria bacterium]